MELKTLAPLGLTRAGAQYCGRARSFPSGLCFLVGWELLAAPAAVAPDVPTEISSARGTLSVLAVPRIGFPYRAPNKTVLAAARYPPHMHWRHRPAIRWKRGAWTTPEPASQKEQDRDPPPNSQHLHRTRRAHRRRGNCGIGLCRLRPVVSVATRSEPRRASGTRRSPPVRPGRPSKGTGLARMESC